MKRDSFCGHSQSQRSFTLVEILVVVAIIAVLTALVLQGASIAARKRDRSRVEAQLERLKLVIEDYKLRFGTYPPDNPADVAGSRLYDELRGYGVLNKPGTANPARQAKDYLPALQSDEWVVIDRATGQAIGRDEVLYKDGVIYRDRVIYPEGVPYLSVSALPIGPNQPNRLNYNSSSPKRNPGSYDLWADYAERGTLKRITIGNWK